MCFINISNASTGFLFFYWHFRFVSGVFTAPVRGVYYFRMVAYGRGDRSTATGTVLRKNGQNVVIAWISPPNSDRSMSNGASLQLEVGDKVSVNLWAKAWVYDNEAHYTTFSGHLLFPM